MLLVQRQACSLCVRRTRAATQLSQRNHRTCRGPRCRAGNETPHNDDVGGNEKVQDALVEMLRMQISTQEVKDEVREDAQQRKNEIRQMGDELLDELQKENEINKLRAELAGTNALSETLQQFDDLQGELDELKQQIKSDAAELSAWERGAAAARNEALFFKQLYKADVLADSGGAAGAPADPQAAKRLAAGVKVPAQQELQSPFRLYLFTYMALVLGLATLHDITGDSPSYGLDAMYGVLCSALVLTALGERGALTASAPASEDDDKRPAK